MIFTILLQVLLKLLYHSSTSSLDEQSTPYYNTTTNSASIISCLSLEHNSPQTSEPWNAPRQSIKHRVLLSRVVNHTLSSRLMSRSGSADQSPLMDTQSSSKTGPSAPRHVFVVHSQQSLENNRPPDVDNKPLARQKRKRTR